MRFQTEIENKLSNTTFKSLPKSLILCGEEGCGRHLLVKEIAEKFNLETVNITDKLDFENISKFQMCTDTRLYYIDCDRITTKAQNAVLKFLEETPETAVICLIVENRNKLLPTIKNRCETWVFRRYTKEELREFTADDSILEYATTPGQVISFTGTNLSGLKELCEKIFKVIHTATVPNALSISNKIAWKSEPEKYNIKLFYKCLYRTAFELAILDQRYYNAYIETKKLLSNSDILNIDQKKLFEDYLVSLKEVQEAVMKSED